MLSLFAKLKNKYFREFIEAWGREPQTPKEWMTIQDNAVRELNKTKGVPPGPKKPWHQGWKPTVIQGGKKEGIGSLIRSGDVKLGVAPKTTAKTLADKKDRSLLFSEATDEIEKIKLRNKQAIKDFKKKHGKKTVEDFRDEGDFDPGGMASGGRTGYFKGKIVKGGRWFIKNLETALKDLDSGKWKNLDPMQKEEFRWELKGLIGRIKQGEPIPEDMIKTIRDDPKFATISKTRSTDPDLYEFEDVILNYGKKGDVSDQTIKEITGEVKDASEKMLLDDFDVTGQTKHADGGRIGMMYGGDPGFAFEYGGSWADWHDQHRDQMPVEQYIKTKLPKHRLPFRDMQSGGLAYMLGEPTYMKYSAGGSVGHAPWHKPTGQQQPPAPMDTPPPQVAGTPDPLKAPRGLPSVAPKNMDPAYMQQQMMQQAMMGRGMMGQGPRPMAAEGGRIGFKLGSINKGRRAFMKWLAGIMGTGVAAGTGLLKLGSKAAPKVIKEAEVIARGADGMPKYVTDLIEVVKAKGTRDIIEGFKKSDYSTVHRYKGVEVIEDPSGAIRIKQGKETPLYGSDEPAYHEIEMEIKPGQYELIDDYKSPNFENTIKTSDEYFEGTVRPDRDGKLKDVEEFIEDGDHLDLKKIADELHEEGFYYPLDAGEKLKGKASGGVAHLLGE